MSNVQANQRFTDYYASWVQLYKANAVRPTTLHKYEQAQTWLEAHEAQLRVTDLDRRTYQRVINAYAAQHAHSTTSGFHHQLKAAVLDALDDGLLAADPTRRVVIKGDPTPRHARNYLDAAQLHQLLRQLTLGAKPSWDWFLLLVAKTGLRFAEALAVTPADLDVAHRTLRINKTWNYRRPSGGFLPTKNRSSERFISLDPKLAADLAALMAGQPADRPLFVRGPVYNSTVNTRLRRLCRQAGVPVISLHGLRHTHASLLLYGGVSIASVARRLGHSSITTTQKTYLHVIKELAAQDEGKLQALLTQL